MTLLLVVSKRAEQRSNIILTLLLSLLSLLSSSAFSKGLFSGKDVILFLTDQERKIMHFPPGWEEENLPGITRLKKNGLTFSNAKTNACMCSPARATLLSGFYTRQNGVSFTLDQMGVMPPDQYPQVDLFTDLPGLAYAAIDAGYEAVYKGKLHVNTATGPFNPTNPQQQFYTPSDASKLGWSRWNPPDAGGSAGFCDGGGNINPYNQSISWPFTNASYPGGCGNHDERYMYDDGPVEDGKEGVLAYLKKLNSDRKAGIQKKPVFLVVSLINPHDLLMYPGQAIATSGVFANAGSNYNATMLQGPIQPPSTIYENLAHKPTSGAQFAAMALMISPFGPSAGLFAGASAATFNPASAQGGVSSPQVLSNYINFYGNLIKMADSSLVTLLDALDSYGMTNNTVVVRTADHGEMGLTHGRSRQKYYSAYKEVIDVPLVFSNPLIWPNPVVSDALVSHVDFVPTIASLIGTKPESIKKAAWAGVDYSSIIAGLAKDVQDHVLFLWDDSQLVEPIYVGWMPWQSVPFVSQPNHLVALIEKRYKLAMYYDPNQGLSQLYGAETQYEMYDMKMDPDEVNNLGSPSRPLTSEQAKHFTRLKKKLASAMQTKLNSRPGTKRVFNISAHLCTSLPGTTPSTYFGSAIGQPFGNSTVTLFKASDGHMQIRISGYMGSVAGKLKPKTSNTTHESGNLILAYGTGYFHSIVSGTTVPYKFARPSASDLCPIAPWEPTCYNHTTCPGTFVFDKITEY